MSVRVLGTWIVSLAMLGLSSELVAALVLDGQAEKLTLMPHTEYFSTENSELSHEQVWRGDYDGEEFQSLPEKGVSFGYSTLDYWLRIPIRNSTDESLTRYLDVAGITLDDLRVWVYRDGVLQQEYVTGDLHAFSTRPLGSRTFVFPLQIAAGSELTVLIHMRAMSSIFAPMYLWQPQAFDRVEEKTQVLIAFYFGCMFIMIGYNLFIYLSVRHLSYLFYSLFVACITFLQAGLHGFGPKFFWGDNFWLNVQSGVFAVSGSVLFAYLFSRAFLQITRKDGVDYYLIQLMIVASGLICLTGLIVQVPLVFKVSTFLALVSPIPLTIIGIRRSLRGDPSAKIYTLAWIAFLSGTLAIAMNRLGFIGSNIFTTYGQLIGSAIEVMLLSLALANRLNELKSKLQESNRQLKVYIEDVERIVAEKTLQIRSILKHIQQGIFTVNKELKVEAEHSQHLHQVLGTDEVVGQGVRQLILDPSNLNEDAVSQQLTALEFAIGEDVLNFDVNQGRLMREIILERGEQQKILQVDWNPIVGSDDVVHRILVCLRDVTDLKKMEAERAEKEEELRFVAEILNVSEMAFAKFLRVGKHLLDESFAILEKQKPLTKDGLNLLFLNMHTFKGTARGFDFQKLTAITHRVEQAFVQMREQDEIVEQQVREGLEEVKAAFDHYETLATEKLGRQDRMGQTYISIAGLGKILSELRLLDKQAITRDEMERMRWNIESVVNPVFYTPVRDVLDQVFRGAPRLAKDLGKLQPKVIFERCLYEVDDTFEQVFQRVFIHLLRNSMFHGIETPEEREAQGKPPQGTIRVAFDLEDEALQVSYRDDGRGLDLTRIREKAAVMGCNLPVTASPMEIAELIFTPYLSTAESSNDISGRGVGMDAIRSYLEEHGGKLHLIQTGLSPTGQFMQFELLMLLPPPHFAFEESHARIQLAS